MISFDDVELCDEPNAFVLPISDTFFITDALEHANIPFKCYNVDDINTGKAPVSPEICAEGLDALMDLLDSYDYYPSSTYCAIVSCVPRSVMEERFCALFGPDMDPDVRAYRREIRRYSQMAPRGRYTSRKVQDFCFGEASLSMLTEIVKWLCQAFEGDVQTFVATLDSHLYPEAEQDVLVQDARTGAFSLRRTRDVVIEITSAATAVDDWSEIHDPHVWAGTARSERVFCEPARLQEIVRNTEFYQKGSALYKAYLERCADPGHDHPMEFALRKEGAQESEFIRLLGFEPQDEGEGERLSLEVQLYDNALAYVCYGEPNEFAAAAARMHPRLVRTAKDALVVTLERNTTWPPFVAAYPKTAEVLTKLLDSKHELEGASAHVAPNALERLLNKLRIAELETIDTCYPLQQGLYFPQRPAEERWMAYHDPAAEPYLNTLFDAGWKGQMWTENNLAENAGG